MQIKVISVPVVGGEAQNEELNQLLRSKKVVEMRQELVTTTDPPMWCFFVKFVEDFSPYPRKGKVDYREVLSAPAFARFSRMREIRKQVADEQGVRSYIVFTDAELAAMAEFDPLTREDMLSVKGIGKQKTEKYATYFVNDSPSHETSESSAAPD